jgi:hypothetical protein
VIAAVQTPNPSQLQITAFERQVSQLKDPNGVVIPNPTTEQANVSTLDHLCAANNHPLPGTSSFSWNWVVPTDVDQQSGVIAINRNTLADFFLPQILPTARSGMIYIEPTAEADALSVQGTVGLTLQSNQEPTTTTITTSGENVIRLEYKSNKKAYAQDLASYYEVKVVSTYEGDVKFKDATITVVQHIKI